MEGGGDTGKLISSTFEGGVGEGGRLTERGLVKFSEGSSINSP